MLASEAPATERQRILHQVYGDGTRELLRRAGIRPGMRVADLGCGTGLVTVELVERVGRQGSVVGVDINQGQLDQAVRSCWQSGYTNVNFVRTTATDTGLPAGTFDLVYCRFLLLQLADPVPAMREMHRLLRPGGIVVCEDGELTTARSLPSSALGLFADLFGSLGPMRHVDYTAGQRLYHLVRDSGFDDAELMFNQPAFIRGEEKGSRELSTMAAAPAFGRAGIAPVLDLHTGLRSTRPSAGSESMVAIMPRMAQVSAVKLAA
ncbi:MAG: methyltransferase domain-containing protein [Gemmatimonadota bacterium]